jgi:DinB superfamily
MSIAPDTKDWTWVLERTCPQCGFDTRTVTRQGLPEMLTENAGVWDELLNERGETSRLRPSPDRWSTLEYACHVRDVFRKFDERLQVMVSMEDPTFLNWDQDATAVDDRYHEQSPVEVASQLTAAAGRLATRFSQLTVDQWGRPGSRSDGARFTIESLGRYLMHDPVHHLYDVGALSAPYRAQIRVVSQGGGTKSHPWRRFAGAADYPGGITANS